MVVWVAGVGDTIRKSSRFQHDRMNRFCWNGWVQAMQGNIDN